MFLKSLTLPFQFYYYRGAFVLHFGSNCDKISICSSSNFQIFAKKMMSSNQIKTTWCNDVRSKNSISHVNQQTFCDSFQRKFPVKRVGNKLFNWYEFPNIPKLPIFGRQLQWPTKKSVCRMHRSSYSTPTFVIVLTITLMVFIANIVLLPKNSDGRLLFSRIL